MPLRLRLTLILAVLLTACVVPPPPSPLPTPTLVSPLPTPPQRALELPNRSKLSVMVGLSPRGLDDFLTISQPTVIYSLNNCVTQSIIDHSPHTLLVRRIQNDIWERLPSDMWRGLGTPQWAEGARISARNWAITKTISMAGGRMNYMQYVQLCRQDFVAPLNEPVLGEMGDYLLKAQWLNEWYLEWLKIAHSYGLRSAIYSFPTGNPALDTIPYLVPSARLAAQYGDIIDLHEYGDAGALMNAYNTTSGALRYRLFYNAFPPDARPRIVISEFSSGNGYDTGLHGQAWIDDALAYGLQLRNDSYLIGAAAFQLDTGAESNIPPDVLMGYGNQAANIDWTLTHILYLPVVRK